MRAAHARDMRGVVEAIRRHRSFLVCSHVNPEGDALGSALGLASLLKRLKKKVTLANEGGIPEVLRFLPRLAPLLSRPRSGVSAEVAMVVDVPSFARVGSMEPLVRKARLTVNIDHHVSNQRFADVNWVDPSAAAVGEMIWRLYRAFKITPTPAEALCLYVSLVSDTGSFRYMNTTPRVHRIVAQLIDLGVDPLKVSQALFESHTKEDLKFLGRLLSSTRSSPDGRIAWLEVPRSLVKAYRASPDMVDELVNYPRSVGSAEVALVFREIPGERAIRVSLRSKGAINVDGIARRFGGGGHRAASGCTVPGSLSTAREKMLKVVREALKRSP